MAGKVLVVDDEPDIVDVVRAYLEREGYEVQVARDGANALDEMARFVPDVVVLDVMLPRLDGLEVCREIRKSRNVPILMLSARGDDLDKILGLEVGADDYLTKPFSPMELVARVRAMLRRSRIVAERPRDATISHGSLVLDAGARRVMLEGQEVHLTPIEFSLLHQLMANRGQVLTRQNLLDRCWGADFFGVERTVDVHLRNLRLKLQKVLPSRRFIISIRGVGYRFED